MQTYPNSARWRSPHARAHLRLAAAIVAGIVGALVAERFSGGWSGDWATSALIGWDVAAATLVAGTWRMMSRTTRAQLKRKAAQQDEGASTILGLMLAAIAASLGGVVAEIHNARVAGHEAAVFVAISLVTIVLSWICMHVLFATHYAHRYYGDTDADTDEDEGSARGLIFPEKSPAPEYFEFVYLAFCIGMTYQVADIMTSNRAFRRLITLHAVLSFFFNTVVIALAVGLFGGLGG